eukprot:NODE_3572_length_768_cov_144.266480.p2 GENE.NODE_3572_length_768_cov_144.266480~~NODE_3572_length_768_cov_144.266480.p2  ORF type:complete len:110 (+),score=30.62 NODE_3572_length_768_cov_144.266480:265-594(+)
MNSAEGCHALFALFGEKPDEEKCPQVMCPKALGVAMKLTCGGDCCPKCWVPDHIGAMERHRKINAVSVVDKAPQAPETCDGVRCFKPLCAAGFQVGHVQCDCCYSCVAR